MNNTIETVREAIVRLYENDLNATLPSNEVLQAASKLFLNLEARRESLRGLTQGDGSVANLLTAAAREAFEGLNLSQNDQREARAAVLDLYAGEVDRHQAAMKTSSAILQGVLAAQQAELPTAAEVAQSDSVMDHWKNAWTHTKRGMESRCRSLLSWGGNSSTATNDTRH